MLKKVSDSRYPTTLIDEYVLRLSFGPCQKVEGESLVTP
jgi:hypothetical protein